MPVQFPRLDTPCSCAARPGRCRRRRALRACLSASIAATLAATLSAAPARAAPGENAGQQASGAHAAAIQAAPATAAAPWLNRALDPDRRADLLAGAMTLAEKLRIVHGVMGRPRLGYPKPEEALGSGGYVPGIARLGIPALQETDAGVGITNPYNVRPGDGATALPATLAVAASFSPRIGYNTGVVLGDEAFKKGFNVVLAGGVNLVREPRNGRNFEYPGEDPLLAGLIAGETVRGIQSAGVASTVKHFALNNQESGRLQIDVQISEAAARESDLLAFEIAIARGRPASVMCAYNQVNSFYACENDWLLNRVLKQDWAYPGWVMSDWGAVHSTQAVLAGLDQESGEQLDRKPYLGTLLAEQVAGDPRYARRLDDMVHRILRSLFAVGLFDRPARRGPIDWPAHAAIAQEAAEAGIVLLKNQNNILPLAKPARIAIIGGQAEFGVLAGGGSSYTTAIEGPGIQTPAMGITTGGGVPRMMIYHPSSPFAALKELLPQSTFTTAGDGYPKAAAAIAREADIAIVFATQWTTESADVPDLALPNGQDALIAAVAEANPHTVVVLETGGPVQMPWLDKVAGVIEAWYPGGRGGQAIANILTGRKAPAGRLPVSFPASEAQLPRTQVPGFTLPQLPVDDSHPAVPYAEGSDVGYRWHARQGTVPLFPFGYGLTYTSFAHSGLTVTRQGGKVAIAFDVTNTGTRAGADVPQVYVSPAAGGQPRRLVGFERLELQPGETRHVRLLAEDRVIARWDQARHRWAIQPGAYRFTLARDAADKGQDQTITLPATTLRP